MTGRRKAAAVLSRMPSLIVSWANPTPSSSGPLWSSLSGMPASCAASTAAAMTGWGSYRAITRRGPPSPW